MTNQEIYLTFQNLYRLRECDSMRFPARVSFAIIHNMKQLAPIVSAYEDTKTLLLQENGSPSDEQANTFIISPDKISYVTQELSALDSLEVEVSIQKIKMSDLDGLELSLQDMDALYFMIDEEEG